MILSEAWGKMIHEETRSKKSRDSVPSLEVRMSIAFYRWRTDRAECPASLPAEPCHNVNVKKNMQYHRFNLEVRISIVLYSWRTDRAECPAARPAEPGPCQLVSPELLAAAETACHRLLGPPFSACHVHVEPGLVYNSCLDDVCACRGSLSSCLCPILAAYADRCSAKVHFHQFLTM